MALASAAHAQTAIRIDPLFTDHMVLQRGKAVSLRGDAPAGATVTVRFSTVSASGKTGSDGRWRVTLPAIPDGASGVLEVDASSGGSLRLNDVVAGDVFLCSGQSNMDLSVSDTSYPKRTAEEGQGKPVRIFKVKRTASPRTDRFVTPDLGWSATGPDSLPDFSAACWHMARTLAGAGTGAPIGLVQSSWGGTSIEDWISPESLATLPAYADDIKRLSAYAADPRAATAELVAATDAWAKTADPAASAWHTAGFDDSQWPQMPLPGVWERSGIGSLRAFDGLMWYRRAVELTAEQAGKTATLKLGRIDERDQVWINGQLVGATLLGSENRAYAIPAGVLKAGRNLIAIRVLDERGAGGLMGKAGDVRLDLSGAPAVDLSGPWKYQTGAERRNWKAEPPFVPWAAPRGVSMLWNGMVAPLDGFPLKGIAWYQGETNTADAEGYPALLGLWASSWRRFFNDPTLPVVIAQLPGYGPRSAVPTDGDWAKLREAQRLTVAKDPRMGLAVLIDLGVSYDIHPAHKDEVGERLGNEMLRLAYGRKILPAPSPAAVETAADGIRVRLADTGGSLIAYGSHEAATFELCDGAGKCRFVPAQVEGDSVRLPADATARQVRYAWQGSPPVNLYGKGGLPVVPFSVAIPTRP
ncbi:sialate O-acetylesterase [Asticcacaulis sp. AND118]|uniref:sialate O-acetylesterase n=1 Tax=Asticcacaulis sp. AND118 TaxID=2840468 RepID=UPI001CFF5DC0|nr:sialate O-acetylesterase [Asticcacaulis sp. AND118]UDF05732.1 beta galactosidase jelly roll domain-containing protein [Asticcacaulis sp. AND118]